MLQGHGGHSRPDPVKAAGMMIAHIDKKRKALGLDKARERVLFDMAMRRAPRLKQGGGSMSKDNSNQQPSGVAQKNLQHGGRQSIKRCSKKYGPNQEVGFPKPPLINSSDYICDDG